MNKSVIFYTLLRKEAHRIIRLWTQTLLPPRINMSLYFFIFGKILGSHVGDIAGVSYAQFITPGLITLSMTINAYMNASSSLFLDKFQGCLMEMIVAPIPEWMLVAGFMFGGLFRGLLVGLLVALSGHLCVGANVICWSTWFIVATSCCCLFGILGGLNALYANHFDGINFIPSFILTPLTFLGGVFYPIANLPEFWQKASIYNPLVYVVKTMRHAYMDSEISYLLVAFIWISILVTASLATYKINNRQGLTAK